MANERRLIELPEDGIIREPVMRDGIQIGYMLHHLDYLPTVDAVEVVRCGECTQWDADKLYCHHPAGLSYCGQAGAAKGFCCFGERRSPDAEK